MSDVKIKLAHNIPEGNQFLPDGGQAGEEVSVDPATARHLTAAGYVGLDDPYQPGALAAKLSEFGAAERDIDTVPGARPSTARTSPLPSSTSTD